MSQIQRICPQCGKDAPVESRHCPHCGYDSQGTLPVRRNNLPATIGKAALPVLAGVATLALRSAWRLISERAAQQAVTPAQPAQQPAVRPEAKPQQRNGRTIHIRSAWSVGDGKGNWQQGTSEHIIDIDN